MVIYKTNIGINYLYELAIAEGEGFGTAYEYFVKINLLNNLLSGREIRNILTAGLPEKYGFGLDALLFAQLRKSSLSVVDERREVLDKFIQLQSVLCAKNILSIDKIEISHIGDLGDLKLSRHFDIAISCAVVQRIKKEARRNYVNQLFDSSDSAIIYAPNNSNNAHLKITGLSSISKAEALLWCTNLKDHIIHREIGFIDTPPFPPGIKSIAALKKRNVWLTKLICTGLAAWHYLDYALPGFFKRWFSHIIYLYVF
jgi:hypothetical protein